MVETRCQGTGHLTEAAPIQCAGVLHPTAGCDLYVDRIRLPTNSRFESRTECVATLLVIPTAPDFLPEREVDNLRAHQQHLEDMYEQWEAESMEPNFAAPRKTMQLICQLEASAHTRRWMLGGPIGGLITLVAVIASLCMARRDQMTALLRRR
jgi:hypothetical protein